MAPVGRTKAAEESNALPRRSIFAQTPSCIQTSALWQEDSPPAEAMIVISPWAESSARREGLSAQKFSKSLAEIPELESA